MIDVPFIFWLLVVAVFCWAKGFRDGEKYSESGGLSARITDHDEQESK